MTALIRFAAFAALAAAVSAALLAAGLLSTRGSTEGTREAILWACTVGWLGSLAGAIPLVLGLTPRTDTAAPRAAAGPEAVSRMLAAMLLRLGVVGLGALAAIFLAGLVVKPFLLWLAASYLALLVVETGFALRSFRSL